MVQAAPNIHPGGVHGAMFSWRYQSDEDPLRVNNPPMPSAEKLISKKINILFTIFEIKHKSVVDGYY